MSSHHATFGVLGIPVDAFAIDQVIEQIDDAVSHHRRLLISTINTNFLISSRISKSFRLSLLRSDLCTVDGIGMLMMCRIAMAGHLSRVSGADVMERLLGREHTQIGRPLRVFFLGGNEAVADRARHVINKMNSKGICCVGSLNPGFGTMDELSSPRLLGIINDAHADFLVVALGAERGQEWLMRNRKLLNVPVCAHLGAAVNFVAGSIVRAPGGWQRLGFEWLWRIRQEPALAKRYWRDGLMLGRLLVLDALPLAIGRLRDRLLLGVWPRPLKIGIDTQGQTIVVKLEGAAISCADALDAAFDQALAAGKSVLVECGALRAMDAACEGQILRLERDLEENGLHLVLQGLSRPLRQRLDMSTVAP